MRDMTTVTTVEDNLVSNTEKEIERLALLFYELNIVKGYLEVQLQLCNEEIDKIQEQSKSLIEK